MVAGNALCQGDERVELVSLDPQNEGNVAESGLGSLKSHPSERCMPEMAKPLETESR